MKTKSKKHIPYRHGIATEVVLGDLRFYLVARTAVDLCDAFMSIPSVKDPFRDDLSQHVKITLVRTQQEPPKMKDNIQKPNRPSEGITSDELKKAKKALAKLRK